MLQTPSHLCGLCWTLSSDSLPFLDWGAQNWTKHSRISCFSWIFCILGLVPPHNTAFNFQKITAHKPCPMFQVLVYINIHFKVFAMCGRSFSSQSFKFLLSLKQMLSCQQKYSDLCSPQMKGNRKEQIIWAIDWRWDFAMGIHYIWRLFMYSRARSITFIFHVNFRICFYVI